MTLLLDAGAAPAVAGGGVARLWDDDASAVPAVDDSGRTLDDLLSETWDELHAAATAACLVCGHALVPRWSAGAGVVGGRCGNCGSEVS
jgi:hypothetical protein